MSHSIHDAARQQQQFLNVISRDEATRRFHSHLTLEPLGTDEVALAEAHGRILALDLSAAIDVPGFDRSNVDGFALRSADTSGAGEESPRTLRLNRESLLPGTEPQMIVSPGTATPIATGGMVPRGADAVLMIEDSDLREADDGAWLDVTRGVSPGESISFAGTDVARGETVLWAGESLSSREIGVLAALGETRVRVFRRPRVAVISTGDEVVSPGEPLPPGCVYDSNAPILASAVGECGGEAFVLGRVRDDVDQLGAMVRAALEYDVVLLSGGTSKGAGDLSYHVVQQFDDPGIVAHGVALKPGKPICLAVTAGKPVVVLPGFPTSAIFTFHEFVAPVIRALAGLPRQERTSVSARLPMRLNSERGRTEYMLVRLFRSGAELYAYPMGKGSGSVTTFSLADGFLTIPQHREIIDAEERIEVTLLDRELKPADLVVIGSHCVGLDFLLGHLRRRGRTVSVMHVGSQGGLNAVRRGECDLAGIHLLDPATNSYNGPFLDDRMLLIPGYRRMQCFLFRPGDERFQGRSWQEALQSALGDPDCVMVNRNPGSGTRILTDELLREAKGAGRLETTSGGSQLPDGYAVQVKSHNAVAAAVSQQRADWGIAIESVARAYGLETTPIREEHYDFVVRKDRAERPAIVEFRRLLEDPAIRQELQQRGFAV